MPKGRAARRAWIWSAWVCAALAGLACQRDDSASSPAASSGELPLPQPASAQAEGARLSGDPRAAAPLPKNAVVEGEGVLPLSATDTHAALAAVSGERPTASVRPDPAVVDAKPAQARLSAAAQSPAAYERFAGSAFRVEQILRTLATSAFSDLRPVGSTSVVLRANLDAPFRAALKLATRERPLGAAAEVAAYRLSRCLGLTTVPPAVLRHPPVLTLEHALSPQYVDRWPDLLARAAIDPRSEVEAAAIFWVEGMRELPIATRAGREPVLQALLQGNPIRTDQQLMAAQLSDLSAFDLLLGNGDRWSGSNVQGDATGQWLYLRDHDLAFATQLSPEIEQRLLAQLSSVERFSRGLIEHVRALTPARLEQEWNEDEQLARAERSSWLRDRVLPGIMQRRAKLLAHVQQLVFRYGDAAVLAFP